jgi:hypothetical protein
MQGEVFRRRRLPHWDVPGAIYFVTACLQGSIPAQGLLDIQTFREQMQKRPIPEGLSREEWKRRQGKLVLAHADSWLDQGMAVSHLRDPKLAEQVVQAVVHFAGQRYDLFSFAVMPSHFHWVFQPREDWIQSLQSKNIKRTPRERIMHTLKLHTALECNKLLGAAGTFWQEESFDHCVFDMEELGRIIDYVERNPVQVGLCSAPEEWPSSSAPERKAKQIPYQQPLLRGAGR